MGRTSTAVKKRNVQSFDAIIGQRLRERRLMKNMSQTTLGERVGITFQQIQKYEKGTNRLSLSRANQIAKVLEVKPTYFFGDSAMPDEHLDKEHAEIREFLNTRDGIRLARAFVALPNRELRQTFIKILEELPKAMVKS